jgi:prefoldin subunit 5
MGDYEAVQMTPEQTIKFYQEQLHHKQREIETVMSMLETRNREITDLQAAVRVLAKFCTNPSLWL